MNSEYKKVANEINQMVKEDQRMRLGDIDKIDWIKQHEIDKKNLSRIKEIVQEFGCITISKFDS